MVPLTRRAGGIQAYKVIYPPAGQAPTMNLQTHEGYEWFYVLNGQVRFALGEQEFRLGVGEAAEFDTRTPHWIGSADSRPAELLALFGPQESAHTWHRPDTDRLSLPPLPPLVRHGAGGQDASRGRMANRHAGDAHT